MKKCIARKLAAMLAFIVLTTTFASDYNSIGAKASDVAAVESQVQEETTDVTDEAAVEAAEVTEEQSEQIEETAPAEEASQEAEQTEETAQVEETEQAEAAQTEEAQQTEETAQADEAEANEAEQADENATAETEQTEETAQSEETQQTEDETQTDDSAVADETQSDDAQAADSADQNADTEADANAADDSTETAQADDTTAEAEVEQETITVTYKASEGGSVSVESEDITDEAKGSTAEADEGYRFVNWTWDEEVVSEKATFVPENEQLVDGAEFTANFAKVEEKAFAAETVVDNIRLSLYANPGVLPEDAELRVEKVSSTMEEQIEEKIDEVTGEKVEVEKTYSFDINIYSESEGGFVRPVDGTVEVRFSQIEEAKGNDTKLEVYHVEDDLSQVTKMEAEAGETEVAFDAEHFSVYTITIVKEWYFYNVNAEIKPVIVDEDGNPINYNNNGFSKHVKDNDGTIKLQDFGIPQTIEVDGTQYSFNRAYANGWNGKVTIGSIKYHAVTYVGFPASVEIKALDSNNNEYDNFYLEYKKQSCKVRFDLNGGKADKKLDLDTVKPDSKITLPSKDDVSKEHSKLVGWSTTKYAQDAELAEGTVCTPGSEYTVNNSVTLYAVWETAAFTVKYDLNGGWNNKPADVEAEKNEIITLHDGSNITRRDYKLVGWSTTKENQDVLKKDGTFNGTVYSLGGYFKVTKNETLYAVWAPVRISGKLAIAIRKDGVIPYEPNLYSSAEYKYLTNGGKSTPVEIWDLGIYFSPVTSAVGETAVKAVLTDKFYADVEEVNKTRKLWDPEKETVVWYVIKHNDSDGLDGAYHVDGVVINKNLVTLRYDLNTTDLVTGKYPDGVSVTSGETVKVGEANLTRVGYDFKGWYLKNDSSKLYNSGDALTISEDTTLYAFWAKQGKNVNVKIQYYENDGTTTKGNAVNVKTIAKLYKENYSVSTTDIADKLESGYEFFGDSTFNGVMGTEDVEVTFKAKRAATTYVVHRYFADVNGSYENVTPEILSTDASGNAFTAHIGDTVYATDYNSLSDAEAATYEYDAASSQTSITLEADTTKNVLNVYFARKKVNYSVEYYLADTTGKYPASASDTVTVKNGTTLSGNVGQTITADEFKTLTATDAANYSYDEKAANKVETITLSNDANASNVLKLYFTRKPTTYTVTYHYEYQGQKYSYTSTSRDGLAGQTAKVTDDDKAPDYVKLADLVKVPNLAELDLIELDAANTANVFEKALSATADDNKLHVYFKKKDGKDAVFFYILTPENNLSVPADSKAQEDVAKFYPGKTDADDSNYHIWAGTGISVSSSDADYEAATGNLYNIDGVTNLASYVTIPSSVQTAINTYVASAYPNHTYNDVVWYTYKDAGDIGWHVDGYVKGVDVKVIYHKNPENTADDVAPVEDPAKTGSYTVKGANTFTYPGYEFDSWNTLPNGQGTKYEVGETITLRNNLNLYAQWNKVNRTVTYKYETDNDTRIAGAAPVDAKADYHIGDTVTTKAAPTVNGYTFSGWKVESGLTLADNAELVGNTFTMQTDNVVLKGTYTANGNTAYRVEYYQEKLDHADDATGKDRYDQVAAATEDFKTGTTDTPVNAEDYKKAFAGFTFENYEVYGNNEDGQEEKITGDVKVLGDESLVIRYYYKRNTYKVSYQYEDSDSVAVSSIREAAMLTDITKEPYTTADRKTLTYKYGETVTIAADATAENYVFSGWKGTAKEAEEEIADENLAKRIVKRAKEIFDNITGNQAETFVMPAGDVTIKGSFTVKAGPQKVTLSLRKYGVPNPYTGTGQPVNEYYSFSRKNGSVYCGFGEANPLVPIDGYTYVDNPVKVKGEIKYYPYVYDPTFTLANADAYNLVVSDDVKDKITKRLHDGDCGVEYKACTFDDIKWYVYKDSNNGGDLEYHFDGEIDVKCVAVYATPGRNKNYNNQFADLLNADRIDGNNYSQVGVVYLPTSVIEKGLTDDNFADVMARVQNAIVVDSKYMDTNLENKIKDVLKDDLASIVKPGDAENKIDQNITKLDENKSTAGFKKTCKFTHHLDLRVKFEKEDDIVDVCYFVLGAGNELTNKPEAGPQDSCYYIPMTADKKADRVWMGTAKNIDLFDESELSCVIAKTGTQKYDYKSIFDWENGINQEQIQNTFGYKLGTTQTTVNAITEGVQKEFGTEFGFEDVRWYVYKRQQGGSIHIDGYVTTQLSYDSNYPADVTLEHATDKGALVRYKENDTVKDNMFTVPKGYKFIGWGLKNEDGIITASEDYAIGNTVSVTNKLTLYAIWEEQEHVAIRVAVDAEGEKTLTKVYNGEEFDVDADVQVTFTTVTKDAAEIADDSAESEDGSEEAPETMDADGIVGRVSSFIGTAFDKFAKLGTINARAEEETRELTKYVEYNGKTYEVTGLKVKGGKGTHVKLGADKTIGYYDAVLVFSRDDIVIKLDGVDVTDDFDFDFDFEGAEFDGDYPIIGKLQILQRKVTMTSASDEKVDDGEPLTAKTVTENPAEPTETEGFVEGEGATYNVTGIQEGVGESANTFEYTLNEGTFADDYLIETVEGKLTITPKPETAKDEDPGKGEDPKKDEDPDKDPAKPSETPSDDNKTDDTKSGETQTENGESQDGQKTESENDDSDKTDDTKKDDTKKDDTKKDDTKKDDTKKSDSSKDAKKVDSDKSDDESGDESSSDSIQKSSEQNSSDVEAAGGQVLGASRDKVTPETEKAGVLGARRGGTDDNTNTARIFILLVAAGAAATFVVLGKKKNKEDEE